MIALTADGCGPQPAIVNAGNIEFDVENKDAAAVSEAELKSEDLSHIYAEKENLTPGLSASFTRKLAAGPYKIYCPGAKQNAWDFTVHDNGSVGDWHDDPQLVAATDGYEAWVKSEVAQLVTNTTTFVAAVKAGQVDQAKALYAQARLGYEAVEPVAEAFGNLDKEIDGRIDDFANPANFEGFHRIEKALFVDNNLTGIGPIADGLEAHVRQLQTLVATQKYTPIELASGATDLVNEIEDSKITGEEERYSGIDLVDFRGNLDGAMQVVTQFTPFLQKHDPSLVATVNARNAVVETALAKYAATPGYVDSGYVKYTEVTNPERRELSQVVNSLAEAISEMVVVVTK